MRISSELINITMAWSFGVVFYSIGGKCAKFITAQYGHERSLYLDSDWEKLLLV